MEACVGCHSCEAACAEQNGLPPGTAWRRVGEIEGGEFPHTRRLHLSMSCNHCLEPACLIGCPTGAYVKLDNGVVAHQADECIGCQYCTWNCPYSVPVFQPDRRIVTKCDMCLPRLESGLEPACVGACPTQAISVEKVNVAAWRDDHCAGDAPLLPSSDLTLSTTRYEVPVGVPLETFGGSEWALRPEHPHWPLVWLTLLTQTAVGASFTAGEGTGGSPPRCWPPWRWPCRCCISAGRSTPGRRCGTCAGRGCPGRWRCSAPTAAWRGWRSGCRSSRRLAALVGAAGVYASGRLYMVPGRPAWCSPLTLARFGATALALGGLVSGHLAVGVAGIVAGLAATAANLARLARGSGSSGGAPFASPCAASGTCRCWPSCCRWPGSSPPPSGPSMLALACVAGGELIGRYLFYVTVVPLDMPGSFSRSMA